MSSFFTLPASQKKRKRNEAIPDPSDKRRNTYASASKSKIAPPTRAKRDESISGSESDDNGEDRQNGAQEDEFEDGSESENDVVTGAERRLRLAEQYLENIKGEVDEVGFDAAEIDKDLIAERLKEDVAETKGRLYRRIASTLAFSEATAAHFRADTSSTTSVATCPPYVYTVSKDLTLIKWRLPKSSPISRNRKSQPPFRRRPMLVCFTRGKRNESDSPKFQHHTLPILSVAASEDGRFIATGGADKRLIIWAAGNLTPLRVFTQHRDAVTSLAFRRGTNQLYSCSKDRTIKTWSLNELAYVETLFGHQDSVVDIAALAQERCLSVGARDRTARLWKVVEETQLVFRGGGNIKEKKRPQTEPDQNGTEIATINQQSEGSIDRVAMIDEETFVTGSDNGSLSLWTLQKKKPVFTVPTAHGLDPPLTLEESSAEQPHILAQMTPPTTQQPRSITALTTVPYSDLILSGSWDGHVRAWRVSDDKRKLEALGPIGLAQPDPPSPPLVAIRGVINDISVFERGERSTGGICITVAVGKELRLGRWMKFKGKNGAVVFEVPRLDRNTEQQTEANGDG